MAAMAEHNILENFKVGVLDDLCYLHIAKDSHVKINFADFPRLSDDSRVCVSACRVLHSIYRHYKEDFLTDGSNVTAFGLFIKSLLPTLNPPRALGLILPFVHSESLEHSAVAKVLCTELRVAIEKYTGLEDSYHEQDHVQHPYLRDGACSSRDDG
ncbi:hypothetical protein BOTCAL_0124g00210 [Botryotinia calthae]|uniref:Uncharacterized protein n=1 Tax=Botryotinia calthae TaxID=38488 RepID=A0A4Y8D6L3_9HELO|nr:hypothetical protein BOTCAL_0124g00210 [Botryotinia calthae]